MPRAFTAAETAAIDGRLRAAAADAFARKGLRGTTVGELAEAAGISKGAFYAFHESKEALFLALLDGHEQAEHAALEAAVAADPAHGFEAMLGSALDATRRNPLVPVAMSPEGLRALAARDEDEQAAFLARDVRLVERIGALLADAGVGVRVPPTVLTGLMRALVFVGLHRQEIGEGLFDELVAWLRPALRDAVLCDAAPGPVTEVPR